MDRKWKKEVFTIPNLLSIFRLFLAVLFLWIYYREGMRGQRAWMIGILIVSAVTDVLDGKIARKFHMVSELGKILDPIADKVTQGVLLICLFSKYWLVPVVFVLFLVKETYMAVVGARILRLSHENKGAMWYGKLSTVVFYGVMLLLVLFPEIPVEAANVMIGISGICMLLAFVMYGCRYHRIRKETTSY